ncbi:hypothetical protein BCR44DRAFT_90171 [Catenaria anguillulae PL171]|uniref:Uncharacterized protein n=1 Tax=Catenaria anguillulae PL171 TaxID=765915 RepID=A0A1Y2HAJ3_9FUNG|nr:hypothetical protein BCR44DRAFT_90171 [Catenaria anguillulae PL171]
MSVSESQLFSASGDIVGFESTANLGSHNVLASQTATASQLSLAISSTNDLRTSSRGAEQPRPSDATQDQSTDALAPQLMAGAPEQKTGPVSKNWSKVRTALIPEKTINVFEIFAGKNKVKAPIAYVMTITQGIHFKYRIHPSKRPLVCGHVHERLVVGGTRGNVAHKAHSSTGPKKGGVHGSIGLKAKRNGGDTDSGSDDDSGSEINDSIEDLVRQATGSPSKGTQNRDFKTMNGSDPSGGGTPRHAKRNVAAALLDDRSNLFIQDITKNAPPFRFIARGPLAVELTQMVPIPEHGIYVGCSHDETIKTFNAKAEHIRNVLAWQPVLKVQWIAELELIAAIGVNVVSYWTLDTSIDRGEVKVQLDKSGEIQLDSSESRDDWISDLLYESGGPHVYIYSQSRSQLSRLDSPRTRPFTRLLFHPTLHYLLVGTSDGCIQVWNLNNTMVHEFEGHMRAITSLHLYDACIVMSGSRDGTIRLWNLITFQESFRVHVKEEVEAIGLTDRHNLWVHTPKGISIYSINILNQMWSHVNSTVHFLQLFKTSRVPARVLVGSNDGVWRLISPQSGKVLTTCIPVQHNMRTMDVSYSPQANRLFFLMESGDIWIASTTSNPGVMVSHWKLGTAAREDCCCICVYDGRLEESEILVTLLFGATSNGQIVVYTKYGAVGKRYQVHTSAVRRMITDAKSTLLASMGDDHTVRICQVCPTKKDMLMPKVTISLNSMPTCILNCECQILIGTEEGVVALYTFNLRTGDYRQVPQHPRNDDHTDAVMAVSCRKRWGLYVTLGADGIIKVWDSGNVLIREIQFESPPSGMCIANSWMDLLVSWDNRIDIIRHSDYLPPGYVQSISSAFHKSNPPEEPLPLEPNQELSRIVNKKWEPASRSTPWIDIVNLAAKEPERRGSEHPAMLPLDDTGLPLGDAYRRSTTVARQPSTSTSPPPMIPGLASRGYSRMAVRPNDSDSRRSMRKTVLHTLLSQDDSALMSAHQLMFQDNEMVLDRGDETFTNIQRYSSVTNVADTDLTMPAPKPHTPITPGGVLPNSHLLGTMDASQLESWTSQQKKAAVKWKRRVKNVSIDQQQKRSEQYKARLQRLLAMLPKPTTPEPPASPAPQPPSSTKPDTPKPPTPSKNVRLNSGRPPPPPPSIPLSDIPITSAIKEEEEDEPEDLPKLISKALEFHFLQEQQLFKVKQSTSGKVKRELLVDPTPDGLLPLLLSAFERSDALAKKEVAAFMNWLHDEYEFSHPRRILDLYLQYLYTAFFKPVNDLEKELIITLLQALNNFGTDDPEIWTCLLLYGSYGDDEVEKQARSIMSELGLDEPQFAQLTKRVEDLIFMAKRDSMPDGDVLTLTKKYTMAWVRRIPMTLLVPASEPSSAVPVDESGVKKKRKSGKKRRGMDVSNPMLSLGPTADIPAHNSMEDLAKFLKMGTFGPAQDPQTDSGGGTRDDSDTPIVSLLNDWISYQKERERLEELARQEALARLREKQERDRLIAERLRAEQEALEAKEAARRAREEERLRELARQTASPPRSARDSRFANAKYSTCHPSRESINYRFSLPPVEWTDADGIIGAHLKRLARSLPVELVNPKPFAKSSRVGLQDPVFRTFTAPVPPKMHSISLGARGSRLATPGSRGTDRSSESEPPVFPTLASTEDTGFSTRKRFLVLDRRTGSASLPSGEKSQARRQGSGHHRPHHHEHHG